MVIFMNYLLTVEGTRWKRVLRVFALITLFVGAYALVQGVLVLIQDWEMQNVSMTVVVIYLMVTPFCFAASMLWAYGVHRMAQGVEGNVPIVIGYAMMVMAAVDNLIYISIHYKGDAPSFLILGGIELVCLIICFLYYQGFGNRAMTLCSTILLTASAALGLEEAVRLFVSVDTYAFDGYYFAQTMLEMLIAVESLLFVFGIRQGLMKRR